MDAAKGSRDSHRVSPLIYNSDDRPDLPKCHKNTRVAVVNKIIDWATGRIDQDAFMLWLYGPAGAGKTAIARKVAEIFAEHGLLASFFFVRSDSKLNTTTPVASMAYCVTCVIPDTRELINEAVEADPLILSYPFEVQLSKLFFEPLRLL
jgi:sigma54-dependent transcription regulator